MIQQINKNNISQYIKEAESEGLIFCNSTILYGLFINEKLVAFAGIIIYKKKAIFKNAFVIKTKRGNGYFKELLKYRLNLIKELNIKIVEATCTKLSINAYISQGFKPIKQYKKYIKVRHENIL